MDDVDRSKNLCLSISPGLLEPKVIKKLLKAKHDDNDGVNRDKDDSERPDVKALSILNIQGEWLFQISLV